jgi:hypothetical protein
MGRNATEGQRATTTTSGAGADQLPQRPRNLRGTTVTVDSRASRVLDPPSFAKQYLGDHGDGPHEPAKPVSPPANRGTTRNHAPGQPQPRIKRNHHQAQPPPPSATTTTKRNHHHQAQPPPSATTTKRNHHQAQPPQREASGARPRSEMTRRPGSRFPRTQAAIDSWRCRESNPGPSLLRQGFSERSSLCLYSALRIM